MTPDDTLKATVEMIDAGRALAAPLDKSLETLLRLAAAAVESDEASIIVTDEATGDLQFLVAIGKVADKLKGVRIPAGRGIAGFVFSSGQPIVVGDALSDQNFYAEVDRQTGYSTQTILATPLRVEGEVIGVLEFVNRTGEAPFRPFSPAEMDVAAQYADALATLVDAHESTLLIGELCARIKDQTNAREWLRAARASTQHREMLELAVLVRELASAGEAERALAREMLESFVKYSKSNDAANSFLSFD